MKKKLLQEGYTVIELLTVVGILVVISGILTGIIYSTLRGSNKTTITSAVSQNGNYASSVITNIIIDSRDVSEIDGVPVSDCTSYPIGQSITLVRNDGGSTTLACSSNTVASGSASLLDTSIVEIDTSSLSNCFFSCRQDSGDPYTPPIIEFGFTVTDREASSLFEKRADFQASSSVSLRNYSP